MTRTGWLREGVTLSAVTRRLCDGLGVGPTLLPMADAPRATFVVTDEGRLDFQTWLVRRRGKPTVRGLHFEGTCIPAPGVVAAIETADLVVIAPSNPYVSVDPILTLGGVRAAVTAQTVVAVSPIVGGRAVKGPLAEMIPSLAGEPPSAAAVGRHYASVLDGLVIETGDAADGPHLATSTVMRNPDDRRRLAEQVLVFGDSLR